MGVPAFLYPGRLTPMASTCAAGRGGGGPAWPTESDGPPAGRAPPRPRLLPWLKPRLSPPRPPPRTPRPRPPPWSPPPRKPPLSPPPPPPSGGATLGGILKEIWGTLLRGASVRVGEGEEAMPQVGRRGQVK